MNASAAQGPADLAITRTFPVAPSSLPFPDGVQAAFAAVSPAFAPKSVAETRGAELEAVPG